MEFGTADYKGFKPELMAELGISLYDDHSLDAAKDILNRSLEAGESRQSKFSTHEIKSYLGRIEWQRGNYEESLTLFNELVFELELLEKRLFPLSRRLKSIRVICWIAQRYPTTFSKLNSAAKLSSEYTRAIAHRGETYQLMKRYPEAVADYTRAIELNPKYGWAIAQRGYTYQLMERYPEALSDCNRAIDLNPDFKEAIALRGVVQSLIGDYTQALQDFNRSLELDASSDWTLYFRSLTYRAIHQPENAKADIEQAIKLAQQDYEAKPLDHGNIFNLAIYHLTAGNVDQAKHLYQDALAKAPSIESIKEAIRDLEDLLTVLPNFPNAQDLCSHLKSALSSKLDHPA